MDSNAIEARARFVFSLYDLDNDGTLTRGEVFAAMCERHGELGYQIRAVVDLLREVRDDYSRKSSCYHSFCSEYIRLDTRPIKITMACFLEKSFLNWHKRIQSS
jgi:hypothetical protein